MRHALLFLGSLVPGLMAAPPGSTLTVAGDVARFETARMTLEVRNGQVTRVFNKITGTDYVRPPAKESPEAAASGIVYLEQSVASTAQSTGVVGPTITREGTKVLKPVLLRASAMQPAEPKRIGDSAVAYSYTSSDGKSNVTTTFALSDAGDVEVHQKAEGTRRGVQAVRFGLANVTIRGDFLLPALGGIKAPGAQGRYKFESSSWQWPTGWMVPMAIFQDAAGGLWIHSRDPRNRFKTLRFEELGKATWGLSVDTENYAPFESLTSAESVAWHIDVYEGGWEVPMKRYRDWSHAQFRIPEKQTGRPGWVDTIRLVVKHADHVADADMIPYLEELAKHTEPSRTLLFNTKWQDESKGMLVPHWVPSERARRFNLEARKRGFRTMYFANYIGITPNHPRFAEFRPYAVRNPYTGEEEGWNLKGEWSIAHDIKLYYISPAYKPWRDFQVESFRTLLREEPADGLFIDQSFLMFNDRNGLRDGQSTIDGNLAYHEALRKAVPGIAIGGESVNEVTMQFESFWEHHPLSLEMEPDEKGREAGWVLSADAFPRMVPIMSAFLDPYVRMIGYLGFPHSSYKGYWAWRDALRVYGGIATITKPSLEELRNPQSEERRVLREVQRRR